MSETFDMVVLSVGMETPKPLVNTADHLGIDLDQDHFVETEIFQSGGDLPQGDLCVRCLPGTQGHPLFGHGGKCCGL